MKLTHRNVWINEKKTPYRYTLCLLTSNTRSTTTRTLVIIFFIRLGLFYILIMPPPYKNPGLKLACFCIVSSSLLPGYRVSNGFKDRMTMSSSVFEIWNTHTHTHCKLYGTLLILPGDHHSFRGSVRFCFLMGKTKKPTKLKLCWVWSGSGMLWESVADLENFTWRCEGGPRGLGRVAHTSSVNYVKIPCV